MEGRENKSYDHMLLRRCIIIKFYRVKKETLASCIDNLHQFGGEFESGGLFEDLPNGGGFVAATSHQNVSLHTETADTTPNGRITGGGRGIGDKKVAKLDERRRNTSVSELQNNQFQQASMTNDGSKIQPLILVLLVHERGDDGARGSVPNRQFVSQIVTSDQISFL